MDMGKYVAVGVLAVIVLAAVTYEAPKEGQGLAATSEVDEADAGVRIEGAFGALTSPIAAPPVTPRVEPAPVTTSAPIATQPTAFPTTPSTTQPTPQPTTPIVATTQAASAPRGDVLSYTVKSGQTLSDVAGELLGDRGRWRELYEANKDKLPNPDQVRAGLTLMFPSSGLSKPASAPRATPSTVTTPAGGKSYTVAKGDTLYSIARRELGNGNRWREIKALNRLDSDTVVVGSTLALPAR